MAQPAVSSRTDEALLWCCMHPQVAAAEAAPLPADDAGWESLLATARSHGVLSLIHRRPHGADTPPWVAARLREALEKTLAHNLFLTAELLRILERFAASGVRAMPLKGPALALRLYGNVGLREIRDLDILVHPTDAGPAHRLLEECGYRAETPLAPRQEAFYLAEGAMRNFVRRDGRAVVELHWRLAQNYLLFPLSFEEVWERRTLLALGGPSIPDLAPEDLLLALCAHGAKHRWSRLLWIADVAEFLRHERADWPALLERARSMGCARMLLLGVALAGSLLRAPVPDLLAAGAAGDPAVRTLRDQAARRLLAPAHAGVADKVGFSMFYFRSRERRRDRLLYLWRSATTPNLQDWSRLRLPPVLSVLYYAFRPLRLIWKYGNEVVRG